VSAEKLIAAARLFATSASGDVTVGTGPNMSPRGTLTEYLALTITTLCGRWMREGEQMPNPLVLMPERRGKAQCEPKRPAWGFGENLRVRDLTDTAAGLTTAALADEILAQGQGQVKALISVGGNPMSVWPDQLKTYDAMKQLDLNITLDPVMSSTAKLADYVVAPKLSLEQPGITLLHDGLWFSGAMVGYPEPYAQYHPAIVPPPAGSDLLEEWEFFYGLAQRMGLKLKFGGEYLDMENKPCMDDLFETLTKGSRIPLSEVKKYPHGHIFEDPSIRVLPMDEGHIERLDIGNRFMMEELEDVMAEPLVLGAGYREDENFSHRLISRRMHGVYNSVGRDIPALKKNGLYNPAYMNPADLEAMGLSSGDMVEIESDHSSILGIVEEAPDVGEGVISMAHGFGDAPEHDEEVRFIGSNTGRLINVEKDFDRHTGNPRMSAVPVNVRLIERTVSQ
ncbi:MAG: molybdopterin dinucleotide-binding protein, partial [Gammaproteobacteria bacterium]|nr:molybdopterin dinucleotide-binding protein [Gammaproteobacteria bacterium]